MINIQRFTSTDSEFKEIAIISNLVEHDCITHYEDDKESWFHRDKSLLHDRLLLYLNDSLIGFCSYNQGQNENKRTIFFDIMVDPKYSKIEYQDLLYQAMLKNIKVIKCEKLLAEVYEHSNYSNFEKLLINNQFQVVQKNREYSCDINNVNIDSYLDLIDKLEKEGISFLDSKDSISNNANHYQKLEKLEWNIDQDIPIPNGLRHTRRSFERYMKDKHFFEEKYYGTEIIAIKNNQYIGMTSLSIYHKSEPFKAWTETLGVLKQFRRQGIATALKIKAIQNLLNKGITEVRTDNELNNPMYKINESLGFHAQPSSLEYLKIIN